MKRSSVPGILNCCLLAALTVLSVNAYSQSPAFYVNLVKGEAYVKHIGKKESLLKYRELIFPADEIILRSDQASVTLVDKETRYLTISKKQKYRASDLDFSNAKKTSGVTAKYFHHVWEELLHPTNDLTQPSQKNVAATWGGVSRGEGSCNLVQAPNENFTTAGDSVRFEWTNIAPGSTYLFTLRNGDNQQMIRMLLKDTAVTLLTEEWKLSPRNRYSWGVKQVADKGCDEEIFYTFYLITPAEAEKEIAGLLSDIPEKGSFMYHLAAADRLGFRGYHTEALAHYYQALEVSNSLK